MALDGGAGPDLLVTSMLSAGLTYKEARKAIKSIMTAHVPAGAAVPEIYLEAWPVASIAPR